MDRRNDPLSAFAPSEFLGGVTVGSLGSAAVVAIIVSLLGTAPKPTTAPLHDIGHYVEHQLTGDKGLIVDRHWEPDRGFDGMWVYDISVGPGKIQAWLTPEVRPLTGLRNQTKEN